MKKRADKRYEVKGYDDEGKRISFYGPTPEAAKAARDAAKRAIASVPHDKTLYGYYVNAYLPSVQHRSFNWKAQIVWAMDKHILPAWADHDIRTITRADLQAWFNSQKSIRTSSLRRIKIILSGILNLAVGDEVITRNPAASVRLPADQTPDKRSLSPHEIHLLLSASDGQARTFILLGLCGLRLGEACGALLTDIDGELLYVRRQVLQVSGGAIVTETLKTPQSRRVVALPAAVAKELLSGPGPHLIAPTRKSPALFTLPNNITKKLKEATAAAGIGDVSPHELRHTFVSTLENDLGAPRAVVAELAGKSKGQGLGQYSRSRESIHRVWMEQYWQLIQESGPALRIVSAG